MWSVVVGELGHATAVKVPSNSVDTVRNYMEMVRVVSKESAYQNK